MRDFKTSYYRFVQNNPNMKKPVILLALFVLSLTACKKSDSGGSSSAKATTLETGKWRITASSSVVEYGAPIGNQTVDLFNTFQSCQRDNLFIFNTDMTTTTDEGATKCNAGDPQQTISGTWALLNGDTQLTVVASGTTITADILSFDNNGMQIRYVTYYGGYKATTTTTYVHQN